MKGSTHGLLPNDPLVFVLFVAPPCFQGDYELRASSFVLPSESNETSWLVTNASKPECHSLPRLANINYNVSVRVAIREQTGANWSKGNDVYYLEVRSTTTRTCFQPTA
jgi:hypothetical protein